MNRWLLSSLAAFAAVVCISLVGEEPSAKAGHAGCAGPGCVGWAPCFGCDGFWKPRRFFRQGYGDCACYGCDGSCWGCQGGLPCGGGCAGCFGCGGCAGLSCTGCDGRYGANIHWTETGASTAAASAEASYETADVANDLDVPSVAPHRQDVAWLKLNVPADARVFINGAATRSVGTQRTFASTDLVAGQAYDYLVRVEQVRDNRVLSTTQAARLQPGETIALQFDDTLRTVQRP